jgi:hypothetical protein
MRWRVQIFLPKNQKNKITCELSPAGGVDYL